jgi:chromate transporter
MGSIIEPYLKKQHFMLGIAAFIALFKYKAGIVSIIGTCAITGLSDSFLLR